MQRLHKTPIRRYRQGDPNTLGTDESLVRSMEKRSNKKRSEDNVDADPPERRKWGDTTKKYSLVRLGVSGADIRCQKLCTLKKKK